MCGYFYNCVFNGCLSGETIIADWRSPKNTAKHSVLWLSMSTSKKEQHCYKIGSSSPLTKFQRLEDQIYEENLDNFQRSKISQNFCYSTDLLKTDQAQCVRCFLRTRILSKMCFTPWYKTPIFPGIYCYFTAFFLQ